MRAGNHTLMSLDAMYGRVVSSLICGSDSPSILSVVCFRASMLR